MFYILKINNKEYETFTYEHEDYKHLMLLAPEYEWPGDEVMIWECSRDATGTLVEDYLVEHYTVPST